MTIRVRPLEWSADPVIDGERGMIGDVQYRHVRCDYGGVRYGMDHYGTMEQAKQAAQRDHEQFILNALENEQ